MQPPPSPSIPSLHPQPLFLGRKPDPYLFISEEESPHLPGGIEWGGGLGHTGCPQWGWA